MTIALTGNQQDLAEAVAGFTARHAPIAATRAAFGELAAGLPQPSWQALVRQGFHALHLPESAGGDGASLVELAVVLEQAAFGLFPGPLLPAVLAGQLIAEHAPAGLASRLLPRLVAGATAASAVTPDSLRFLAERGLAAPHYPRPYGIEASPAAQVLILQEFERAGLAQPSTTVGEWALPTILAHCTEEQREAFVGPTLRGDLVWCQLFSEPGAGSDLASLRTRAEKADGGWRLDGQKVWTSQAAEADWAICLARTDPAAPKHKGISYFLVDMHSPGVEVRPLREANGGYLFNEVFLTGVFVPDERLVGNPGDGWRLARTTLGNERVNIATGMGRRQVRPLDYLTALGGQVPPGVLTQALTECGAITADLLAFTAMSQRLLLRQIAGLQQGPEASVLKVAAAWNATRLQQAVLSWQGPGAATMDGTNGAAPRRYLSLPPTLIGGGTLEIQLNVIAERVLGLPR